MIEFYGGHYEQPFFAQVLKQIGIFWMNHWQWILGFLVSISLVIVAIITVLK